MGVSASLVLDILLLVVVFFTALCYAKKGLLAGIFSFGGGLLSLAAALFVSNRFSPTLFQSFFEKGFLQHTTDVLQGNQGFATLEDILTRLAPILPANLIEPLMGGQTGVFDLSAPDIAQQIVNTVVQPLVLPLISIVLFFAVFFICRLLAGLLVAALTNVNKIPVVGGFNRAAGFAGGILVGVLYLFLFLCVLWAAVALTGGEWSLLNQETLNGSYAYQFFSKYIPFM